MKKVKKKKKVSGDRPIVSAGDYSAATDGLVGNRTFVSISKTINIGNYESIRVECGMGKSVPDGERFDVVFKACRDEALTDLLETVKIVESQLK